MAINPGDAISGMFAGLVRGLIPQPLAPAAVQSVPSPSQHDEVFEPLDDVEREMVRGLMLNRHRRSIPKLPHKLLVALLSFISNRYGGFGKKDWTKFEGNRDL